jgi:SAM-dependent methyltransferase
MKLRDSGMPDETWWEGLFDVPLILDWLGIDTQVDDAVELGCGYGTFTIPVARRIRGRVFAFDIEAGMVARTQQRVREAGLTNVLSRQRDVVECGYGLAGQSVDGCLLFNILLELCTFTRTLCVVSSGSGLSRGAALWGP